ncbi:MAG TPA: DUF1330 domain-containing protein [Solirubrobacteraceae bacterium]|nr:DUF1330 domain-containing protein [Solirubrobacteraceae bacterium]
MPLTPTQSQIEGLAASDSEEPVVMLNLLRFKDLADGIDEGVSGRDAYARYGAATAPFLAAVGGRVISALDTSEVVIGLEQSEWDAVLLVEYPSRKRFLEMASNPDYLAIHAHREAALQDSRLIACAPMR